MKEHLAFAGIEILFFFFFFSSGKEHIHFDGSVYEFWHKALLLLGFCALAFAGSVWEVAALAPCEDGAFESQQSA